MLLTHALALSANQFLCEKKSLRVCALGENWTHEIDFSRHEDSLPPGTPAYTFVQWVSNKIIITQYYYCNPTMCSVRPLQKMAKKQKKEKAWKNEMSHRFDAQKNSYCTPKRLCISSVKQRLSPSSKHFPRSHWILFSARGRHLIRPAIVVPAAPYELGQLKSGQRFLKSNLVNHWKLGLENWTRWPWHNSQCICKSKQFGNPTRSRRDTHENSQFTISLATFLP